MKILKKDIRHGVVRIRLENPDDLWHLEKILNPGDLVTARTFRRTTVKRGQEIGRGERKPVTLEIKLEKLERETGRLRLRGPIVSGPEDIQLSSYHSILAEPNLILTIKKEKWKPRELDRLKKAGTRQPLLFICVLDREQADFASLTDSGIRMMGTVRYRKKLESEDRTEYYREIEKTLESAMGKYQAIVLAGPGFEKENLLEFLDKANPELAGKIILEYASHTGKSGVQEVIKRSGNKILKENRISKETGLVENLLEEIAKDGPVVYGPKETEQAAEMGAVETLLVSEEKAEKYEKLIETVERHRGRFFIISGGHESAEKFLNLGGVAAFLRFKV